MSSTLPLQIIWNLVEAEVRVFKEMKNGSSAETDRSGKTPDRGHLLMRRPSEA